MGLSYFLFGIKVKQSKEKKIISQKKNAIGPLKEIPNRRCYDLRLKLSNQGDDELVNVVLYRRKFYW